MANWDKLNKEFSDLMDSFTDSDWENWERNRRARKALRRMELLLKAKIQSEKLNITNGKDNVQVGGQSKRTHGPRH